MRTKPSTFSKEVFFLVAVRANYFNVFRSSIKFIFVDVMNLKYAWNFIVTAFLTSMRPCCESFLPLCVYGGSWSIQLYIFSKKSSALYRTKISLSILKFMREFCECFSANRTRLFDSRKSFNSFGIFYKMLNRIFTSAFSTAKFVFSCLGNLLFFATNLAFYCLQWFSSVMAKQKLSPRSLTSKLRAASTGAYLRRGWSFGMERQVVVFDRSFRGKVMSTPAGAQLRVWAQGAFLAFRRAWPRLRVVVWSTFGHGIYHLFYPSQKQSLVSSWRQVFIIPISLLQGAI